MDFNPQPYNVAFHAAEWGKLVLIFLAIVAGVGLLASLLRHGAAGPSRFVAGVKDVLIDLFTISPQRVYSLTVLTVREAVRRKALLVFVVFAILLMFAGWFVSSSSDKAELQLTVYISLVLTIISWLILPVAIFLSCWGIPEDIRKRSMHTVVTKPARRTEIVLGRIIGFSLVNIAVLVIMGVVGYVWIQRNVAMSPAMQKSLVCRVPVYGTEFFFFDRQGRPTREGINTGDPWGYRGYVEGNSQSRAIFLFDNITPETVLVTDEATGEKVMQLEASFEAFRTLKGTRESKDGLRTQYTLVRNPREVAFAGLSTGVSTAEAARFLRAGQFNNAADEFEALAEKLRTNFAEVPDADYMVLQFSCEEVGYVLPLLDADLKEVEDAFAKLENAAKQYLQFREQDNREYMERTADALSELATALRTHSEVLFEAMPRIEIPLEPFRLKEYREGNNTAIPQKLKYLADYESTARFLAATLTRLNSQPGSVVSGGALADGLIDALTEDDAISLSNADILTTVLAEDIGAGTLTTDGDVLAVADGRSLLRYFDEIVRAERLPSQEAGGWELTADLFDDLTYPVLDRKKENTYEGRLRVEVSCLESAQFVGMARPDLFVRLPDRGFWVGYLKAICNIGLMLTLVVVLGVTASCFAKGPVALLLTLSLFVVGQFFHPFMNQIIETETQNTGQNQANLGMIKSSIMMLQHRTPTVGPDVNERTLNVIDTVDKTIAWGLRGASSIIPDFNSFSGAVVYVEKRFDVPWNASVVPALTTFLGFFFPCLLLAVLSLKFRELESK